MTSGSRRSTSPEDDLRLPRPPGLLRRFWSRHPLAADILVAAVCLLLSLVPAGSWSEPETGVGVAAAWPATAPVVIAIIVLGCVALVFRRRFPLAVFVGAVVVAHASLLAPVAIGGPLVGVAVYAVAVYRGTRPAAIAVSAGVGLFAAVAAALAVSGMITESIAWNAVIGETVLAVIGGLVGANVGNRKRYVDALIAHSRRLVVERDQQAQLAAASERERIARELHDIVAHSLTVMVALAEGVAASHDIDRARPGATAVAATGREALRDMRATLGVLREPGAPPLTPVIRDTTAETVASARAAGFDAHLTVSGDPTTVASGVQLAVSRVVQESVTNAMRHAAGATRIDVSIAYRSDAVEVTITDDGAPVTSTAIAEGGYGLRGLRERVALAGGEVEAGPRTPRGWGVRARMPRQEETT